MLDTDPGGRAAHYERKAITMGLFGKKDSRKIREAFNITMTADGKLHEGGKAEVFRVEDECEFEAIRSAEKQHPHMKVAKVVKA